jgi:hypothetical protein
MLSALAIILLCPEHERRIGQFREAFALGFRYASAAALRLTTAPGLRLLLFEADTF